MAPANSFLKRFWEDVDHWNNNNPSNQSTPTPQIFGYDNTLSNTLDIEKIYDNSQTGVRAIIVKEGEWIGDFGITKKIGFEVILETSSFYEADFNYPFDLSYLRAEYRCIDITGLLGFDKRAKQELILSYIDPAAFFGLHYEAGINISVFSGGNKTLENKKQNDLYTLLLEKFATRNRLYIDIRSEKGYSYNFYQNYKDNSNDNIKIGNGTTTPVAQSYSTNNWPIVFTDTPVATSNNVNNIKISVRIDDNIKPIIFLENTALLGSDNRSKFINEYEILNGTTTGWSKDLMFQFPNVGNGSTRDNVAYYIKLNYFRQQYNPSSPNSILKNENYFDSAFCPINLPNIADNNYKFQQIHNHDINYVRGVLPNITNEFDNVADSGAFWDNERVLFYSQAIFTNNSSGIFYSKNKGIENKFSLKGSFFGLSFLKNDINISCKVLQESTGVNQFTSVKSITLSHYNGFPSAKESMLVLGIKSNELQSLIDAAKEINPSTLLPNLSSKHNQYLFIEEDSASPKIDKNGISFRKFKLKVQGFTPTGTKSIIAPVNDIYLYTKDGLCFTSKDFAASELVLIKEDLVSKIPFSNDKPENIINRLTTKNINVLEWNIYDKDGLPLVFAVNETDYDGSIIGNNEIKLPVGLRVTKIFTSKKKINDIYTIYIVCFFKGKYREGFVDAEAFKNGNEERVLNSQTIPMAIKYQTFIEDVRHELHLAQSNITEYIANSKTVNSNYQSFVIGLKTNFDSLISQYSLNQNDIQNKIGQLISNNPLNTTKIGKRVNVPNSVMIYRNIIDNLTFLKTTNYILTPFNLEFTGFEYDNKIYYQGIKDTLRIFSNQNCNSIISELNGYSGSSHGLFNTNPNYNTDEFFNSLKSQLISLKNYLKDLPSVDDLRQTPEFIWFNHITHSDSYISNLEFVVSLHINVWYINNVKKFAEFIAIDQSFGFIDSIPSLSVFIHELKVTTGSILDFPDDTHSYQGGNGKMVSQNAFEYAQSLELGEIILFLENGFPLILNDSLNNLTNYSPTDVRQDFFQRNSSIGMVYLNYYLDYVL